MRSPYAAFAAFFLFAIGEHLSYTDNYIIGSFIAIAGIFWFTAWLITNTEGSHHE